MQKLFILQSCITVLLTSVLVSFASIVRAADENKPSHDIYYGNDENKRDVLAKLLQIPEVKKQYDACSKIYSSNNKTDIDDLEKCLWDGNQKSDAQGSIPALSDNIKKNVSEIMLKSGRNNNGNKDTADKNDAETSLATFQTSNLHKVNKAPEIVKLERYLYDRLIEAMYGKVNDSGKKFYNDGKIPQYVDHAFFMELYNTQVSKNLIATLSSYCLDADSADNFLIYNNSEKQKEQRNNNLRTLESFDSNGKTEQDNDAYKNWVSCIVKIKDNCQTQPTSTDNADSNKKYNEQDYKYTQKRACLVTKQTEQLRNVLLATNTIINKNNELLGNKSKSLPYNSNGTTIYGGQKTSNTKETINSLTDITSNELMNKSGYKTESDKQIDNFNKNCAEGGQCEKYIGIQKEQEKLTEATLEDSLRQRAMQYKLSNMTTDETKNYLLTEGYSEGEIAKLTDDQIKKIKDEIARRYDNERKALFDKNNEFLRERFVTSDKIDTKTEETQGLIKKVETEMKQKPEMLRDLIHYNNIISGYISFKEDANSSSASKKKKQETKNTEILFKELKDHAYGDSPSRSIATTPSSQNTNEAATENQQRIREMETIEKELAARNVRPAGSSATQVNITPDTVSKQILGHTQLDTIVKEEEEKKEEDKEEEGKEKEKEKEKD